MSSFDLSECTKKLSERAYALSAEADILARLSKDDAGIAQDPIVLLLTRRSVEVCHLAHIVHQMVCERSRQYVRPSRRPSLAWRWMWRGNDSRVCHGRNTSGEGK
jgi:hypothetical protein